MTAPETSDLSPEQRARLEAVKDARDLLYRRDAPWTLDDLERLSVFILVGDHTASSRVWLHEGIDPLVDTLVVTDTSGAPVEFRRVDDPDV